MRELTERERRATAETWLGRHGQPIGRGESTESLVERALTIASACPCVSCRLTRVYPDEDAHRPDPVRP